MTTRSPLRVAIAAGEAAGQRVLRAVVAGGHEVAAVFAGTGATGAPVRAEAERLGAPTCPAASVKDPSVITQVGPVDVLLNVHSLYLVAPELLEWPRLGSYNLHPGWLPDYAGRNCPSWAVLLGEPSPGVTVHRMSPDVDRGEIATQQRFDADGRSTGGSVAVECAKRGVRMVMQVVDALVDGSLELQTQDASRFRYFGRERPDDGHLRFDRTAIEVDRFVRACDYAPFASPWGTPEATTGDRTIGVRTTRLTGETTDSAPGTVRVEGDRALVACADEWLEIVALTQDGAKQPATVALASVPCLY